LGKSAQNNRSNSNINAIKIKIRPLVWARLVAQVNGIGKRKAKIITIKQGLAVYDFESNPEGF
jgi:hypothetical protein